jgi:hypothetical protein
MHTVEPPKHDPSACAPLTGTPPLHACLRPRGVGLRSLMLAFAAIPFLLSCGPEEPASPIKVAAPPTEADCAKGYHALERGEISGELISIKTSCKAQFAAITKAIATEYTIKGNALYLQGATHSLYGMSIEKSEVPAMQYSAEKIPAIIAYSGEKRLATLRFGMQEKADAAFKNLSSAIAGAGR